MIGLLAKTGFTSTELYEMAFCRPGSLLLKGRTQGLHALACLLNVSTTEGLARAIGCQIDNAQVNTQGRSGFLWAGFRSIKGDGQKKSSLEVEQVGLSLHPIHAGLL